MKKCAILLLCGIICVTTAFAKEKPSLALEVGGTSYEKTSSQRVFNPDVHIGILIPFFDIKETISFGLQVGYDFSYENAEFDITEMYTSSSYYTGGTSTTITKITEDMELTAHTLSLVPTLFFAKKNFRVHLGGGVGVSNRGIAGEEKYEYVRNYSGSTSSSTETTITNIGPDGHVQFLWLTDFGLRYKITHHFSVIGDIELVHVLFTYTPHIKITDLGRSQYEQDSSFTVGGRPLYINPKIGICYTF